MMMESAAARSFYVGRRHRRSKVWGVLTPFGQVIDVSESGACLFRKGSPPAGEGSLLELRIDQAGVDLTLPARVVRIESRGLRRYEIGVEFIGISAQDVAQLHRLAQLTASNLSPTAFLAA